MPVVIEDRPTDKVREEVVDRLIMNYAHGSLSEEAFERRLDAAMASKDNLEIAKLAEDLDLEVDKSYVDSKKDSLGINYSVEPVEEEERLIGIFGSSDRGGRWRVPKKIKSFSIFGASNIDFSDAEFHHPTVTIEVFCLFGGDNIFITEDLNVVTKAFCIFGAIDNKAASIAGRQAPTVIIKGFVIFGAIDIKIKRTIKEKFQSFAESLKKMLN